MTNKHFIKKLSKINNNKIFNFYFFKIIKLINKKLKFIFK